MWQSIMNFATAVMKPAADLVDNVSTTEEERLELRNALVGLQNEVTKKQIELVSKQMDLERQLVDAKASIITAETKSGSWVTRSWRPVTMLTFVAIIVLQALGLITLGEEFSHDFMVLVQLGLGGYVAGRSAEKAIPSIAGVLKNK